MLEVKPKARRRAREFVLQALYHWQLADASVSELEAQYAEMIDPEKVDVNYFHKLLHGILAQMAAVDAELHAVIDRPFAELNPVELAALRIGVYELLQCWEVPYRVVINEALELTKKFGAAEGFKYVNGVLDKVARKVRGEELKNRSS